MARALSSNATAAGRAFCTNTRAKKYGGEVDLQMSVVPPPTSSYRCCTTETGGGHAAVARLVGRRLPVPAFSADQTIIPSRSRHQRQVRASPFPIRQAVGAACETCSRRLQDTQHYSPPTHCPRRKHRGRAPSLSYPRSFVPTHHHLDYVPLKTHAIGATFTTLHCLREHSLPTPAPATAPAA